MFRKHLVIPRYKNVRRMKDKVQYKASTQNFWQFYKVGLNERPQPSLAWELYPFRYCG